VSGVFPLVPGAGATLAGDADGFGRSGDCTVPGRSQSFNSFDTAGSEASEDAESARVHGTLDTDGITGQINGEAIDVQRYLGPGMLEHMYKA
jgi:hypothetical protein